MNEILIFLKQYQFYFPLILFIFFVVRYFFLSYMIYVILWIWLSKQLVNRRIQNKSIPKTQVQTEIINSLISFFAMSLTLTPLFFLYLNGQTSIYSSWNEFPLWWVLISILIFFLWHDIYFYFSHRLLHLPWFFKNIHYIHHQSKVPTPCASHSFHWFEGILQVLFIFPIVLWIPMHPWTFVIYMAVTHFFATWGHFNYELMPYRTWHSWWGSWITTSTHHNHHHENIHWNYGLYLKYWDIRFKTLHQKTSAHFKIKISSFRKQSTKDYQIP